MGEEQLKERLRRLGLMDKEVQVYLAVLENGSSTVNDIVELTDVSKRYVYTITEDLEDRGFISFNDTVTPAIITPTSPEHVRAELSDEVDRLYRDIQIRFDSSRINTNEFQVLKSRETIIQRIRELITTAEDQILLSMSAITLPYINEVLRDALDRDILTLTLVFSPRGEPEELDIDIQNVGHVVRYQQSNIPIMLAVDRSKSLVAPRGAIVRPDSPVQSVVFRQSYLERIVFHSFLLNYWNRNINEQIYTRKPDELPAEYTNIRQAVVEAALHQEQGKELVAQVEGHSTETRDYHQFSGHVEKVQQNIVEPTTGDDIGPAVTNFHIQTGNETVTVGGQGAHIEDYSADIVVFYDKSMYDESASRSESQHAVSDPI